MEYMHYSGTSLYVEDIIGTQLAVQYTVESLYRGHHWDPAGCPVYRGVSNSEVDLYTALYMWFGLQTVSSLERCPLFSALYGEVPL